MSIPSFDRALLASTAALLDQGRRLDRLSCWLTFAGVVGLLALSFGSGPGLAPMSLLILSVLAGLAELYFAARVGFDAALLRQLHESAGFDASDLAGLDSALSRLGLTPPAKADRTLDQRALGACRLLYAQAVSLMLQAAFIVAGAAIAALR